MRLVDVIFRAGHLSEQALVEAVMTGDRPAHLEKCDICADRAVDLGRWLDQVRTMAVEASDVAFPPERLAAQQQQILRRLEQLDQPARVIAFPNQYRLTRDMGGRRVAAGWVAVAAAAGILIGVVSSQAATGFRAREAQVIPPPAAQVAQEAPPALAPASATMLDNDPDLERVGTRSAFRTLDQMTPSMVMASTRTVHK